MRTIVHLSDIHFGRADHLLVEPLTRLIHGIKPHLVAVSGDFTQRARRAEFREARAFLAALPGPQLVVPGNHDVPLYNVFARFLNPLGSYRRYISPDLNPVYRDEEIAVVGINTARSLTRKHGRVGLAQLDVARKHLCDVAPDVIKIVVTHHPFDLPAGHDERDLVGRAELAMTALAECGADLFLSGHLHLSRTGHSSERYKIAGHSALIVQAGTTISKRSRGEANAFNVIHLERPAIRVQRYEWQPDTAAFTECTAEHFMHTSDGWIREKRDTDAPPSDPQQTV
jgi:3',5'-cyclic AMP phosphodiesterase CpdA